MSRAASHDDIEVTDLDRIDWQNLFVEDRLARDCWLELRQWISDADIRRDDEMYDQGRRALLLRRVKELDEIK